MHFASFLSGGFTTMAVINPPEKKLAKRTSVHWVRNLLAPATGRYDVLGSFFVWETGFWVDLFVGHPLVWVADVASVFDKRLF